ARRAVPSADGDRSLHLSRAGSRHSQRPAKRPVRSGRAALLPGDGAAALRKSEVGARPQAPTLPGSPAPAGDPSRLPAVAPGGDSPARRGRPRESVRYSRAAVLRTPAPASAPSLREGSPDGARWGHGRGKAPIPADRSGGSSRVGGQLEGADRRRGR